MTGNFEKLMNWVDEIRNMKNISLYDEILLKATK